MTLTNLNEVKSDKTDTNIEINHLELIIMAKKLSEEIMTLNAKSGVLGEGKCNNLQQMAEEILQYLK